MSLVREGAAGETRDLSEGGMGLLSSVRLERGSEVEVEVELLGGPKTDPAKLRTMAKVMWSAETDSGAHLAGLQFDGPSEEALERLRRFLDSVDDDEPSSDEG